MRYKPEPGNQVVAISGSDKRGSVVDNDQLVEQYERDGFVAIPQFLSGMRLQELQLQVSRFLREEVSKLPPEYVFFEDKDDADSLKQVQQMGAQDPWFHALATDSEFSELAARLLNGSAVAKNMQYFNKPPGIGQATPAHQDGYYFMLEPCEALTMWLALDEVDEENGCVRYIRASHQAGMRQHRRTNTLGFSQGIGDFPNADDPMREVAIHAQPGDLLVHHALTIHRADPNRSATRSRRALGLIYYSERAKEDKAAHEQYQLQLAADLKAAGKI